MTAPASALAARVGTTVPAVSYADAARAIVERTRSEQALPPRISDPAAIRRLAGLLTTKRAAPLTNGTAREVDRHARDRTTALAS